MIVEKVMRDKDITTGYTWSCEMMNDPIDRETQIFKPEHKHTWSKAWIRENVFKEPPQNDNDLIEQWLRMLDIYIGLDPARVKGKRNAFSVILAVGVDTRGREFCLQYKRGQWGAMRILTEFFNMVVYYHTNYNLKRFGMEVEGGDSHL